MDMFEECMQAYGRPIDKSFSLLEICLSHVDELKLLHCFQLSLRC